MTKTIESQSRVHRAIYARFDNFLRNHRSIHIRFHRISSIKPNAKEVRRLAAPRHESLCVRGAARCRTSLAQ